MTVVAQEHPYCCGVVWLYNFYDSNGNYRTDTDMLEIEILNLLSSSSNRSKGMAFIAMNPKNSKVLEKFLPELGFKLCGEGIGQHGDMIRTFVLERPAGAKYLYNGLKSEMLTAIAQYEKEYEDAKTKLYQEYQRIYKLFKTFQAEFINKHHRHPESKDDPIAQEWTDIYTEYNELVGITPQQYGMKRYKEEKEKAKKDKAA